MTNIVIRPARENDISLMARWAEAMAYETEHKRLDLAMVTRGIETGLADPMRARYFMAEQSGEPIGTLMLTPEWSDWRNAWWWWIQSVYVPEQHRRKGAYRALHSHVMELAKAAPEVCGLRLYVERENVNAQRTYEFLGMADPGYRMYEFAIHRSER